MMKDRQERALVAVLAAMALCLGLAACGSPDDAAGEDWRTSGMVAASGTITHEGDSVDVLVTVSESSAAFYWDLPDQVLFDSVSFPMDVPDAERSFLAISFDDIDGDGESDVWVSFLHEDGDTTDLVWIWDPAARYVFREDLSSVALGSGSLSEYVGLWAYQGEALWLRICEDATWSLLDGQGGVIEHGTLWADRTGVTLHFDSSGDVLQLDRTADGGLIDSVGGGTLLPAEDAPSEQPHPTGGGAEADTAAGQAAPDKGGTGHGKETERA